MNVLADFLAEQTPDIVKRFAQRVQGGSAQAASSSQLLADLPAFLAHWVQVLAGTAETTGLTLEREPAPATRAQNESRPVLELTNLTREYGLLQDVLFEHMTERGLAPPLNELASLSHCISSALSASTLRFVQDRQADSDRERRHLLGLFEQAPGFVCFLRGPELVFELANSAYYQLVGHREIVGKSVRDALPEVAGQGYFELLDRVFSSGEAFVGHAMRAQLQREPGSALSEAFIDLIYQPIRNRDGHVMGILVQGNDVSDAKRYEAQHKEAQAALNVSEQRLRELFGAIDDGFTLVQMILDGHGTTVDYLFIEANAAFETHTGLHAVVGKTILELVPNVSVGWFQFYGRVAETGESARFEHHDPALARWFDVYATRVGTPSLRQVAIVFKDITARRAIEQERERLLASESLARKQAEEASQLKDEFLATVSHELRTPLNAMLGWVHLLRSGTLSPERRESALETVERNARAQAKLIEDLLDVSRILAGKLGLQIEPVEVHALVDAALETVRPAAAAKNIRLQPALASGGLVMGDAHRLQQVIWNLLSNAVKFTPKNGRVQVLVEYRDSAVELIVSDTGQGISADFLPFVFERFRQQDGGSSRRFGGLGLGLSIVRQLVELHGGTVSVYSEGPGCGASFTVRLPLAVARRRESSTPPALQQAMQERGLPCPPELADLSVLVVDDEEDAREMIGAILAGCGARVRMAASVREGLTEFELSPPDLLISDIGMPEADGYDLIERIRKLPPAHGGRVPAVALTAYARSEDRTRTLLSGFNSHVSKPVEPLELLAVIASLTGLRRSAP